MAVVANFNTQGKLSVIKSQIRFIAKTNVFTSYKIYNDLITKSCQKYQFFSLDTENFSDENIFD